MAAEIKQGDHKFYVGNDENNPKAVITFKEVDNNEIDIDHTGVSDELGGQGLGKKLVNRVVEHARENNLKLSLLVHSQKRIRKDDHAQDVYLG